MEKEITELTKIRREFLDKKLSSVDIKKAGKILKEKGQDAVREFFSNCQCSIGDFKPPSKVNIVAQSRPFEEWPIALISNAIQKYYFSLTKDEVDLVHPGSSGEDHAKFFCDTGLPEYKHVQANNLIFKHAKAVYDGVLIRTKNKNDKLIKKFDQINSNRRAEGLEDISPDLDDPFDNTGHLKHSPGVNCNIYCYQSCSPKIYEQSKHKEVFLPKEYYGYHRDPDAKLTGNLQNRLEIPEGEPGHVPWFQRLDIPEGHIGYVGRAQRLGFIYGKNSGVVKFSDKTGRAKRYHHSKYKNSAKPYRYLEESKRASSLDSILAIIRIGDDWVVFDIRGLYRDAFYRNLVPLEGLTAKQLLNLFTGDPVIDPKRSVVTFSWKEGVVPVFSKKVVSGYKSRETLEKLTVNGPLVLVSIDLGQNEPVAARAFTITTVNDTINFDDSRLICIDDFKKKIQDYRYNVDKFELDLRSKAISLLSADQQLEISECDAFSSVKAKENIHSLFDIDLNLIPWGILSFQTTYISDLYLKNGGDESKVYFVNGKGRIKRSDYNISRLVRQKLSDDTRKNLNDAIWSLKRSDLGYRKLSKRKSELVRSIVNHVVHEAKSWSGINSIAIVLEDLDVVKFHGCGKRDAGWDSFFIPKKENRWFIQSCHKSFSELSSNRGLCVIEINPAWTSVTCPDCGFCSKDNRDGIDFKCLKCGRKYHADLDVATLNIARSAVLGKRMSGPEDCERRGGAKTPRTARVRTTAKVKSILQPIIEQCLTA